jgi:hypothetical protein
MLTTDLLIAIDRDAAGAPPAWLRAQARSICAGLDDAPADLKHDAATLLIKLDHLERQAQARAVAGWYSNGWALGEVLEFWVVVDDKLVRAGVSRQCLEDHFGCTGQFMAAGSTTYMRNKAIIDAVAIMKHREGDSPVLVTSGDF